MTLFEDNTHAFIVRVWLEPREIEGKPVEWRGVIEHVSTGERRYLNDLTTIIVFIQPYMEQMGIEFESSSRHSGD